MLLGGSIMAVGHFVMAFEPVFYLALAVIALGNGLFLPSLPSQINDLYREDDPRRGRAYNVYYVGLNIGGFMAPLVCGTLGELYGWHYGFGAAGVGMFAGLMIYVSGRRYLPGTMVLETSWGTRGGWIIVRDVLLIGPWHHEDERSHTHRRSPTDYDADHVLLRLVRCVNGEVQVRLDCEPVFEYGQVGAT